MNENTADIEAELVQALRSSFPDRLAVYRFGSWRTEAERRYRPGHPPQETFALLHDAGIIDATLKTGLQAMVGFRNVAVHDYRKLNLDVVRGIVENHLDDFRRFCQAILKGSFA